MSREPGPLYGILPSRHWCIPARQMAGATIRGPRAIFGLGLFIFHVRLCCEPVCGPARRSERSVAELHERAITRPDANRLAALRVAPGKPSLVVATRSFGTTKPRSRRLD